MISIRSTTDLARALVSSMDANLKRLLTLRRNQLLNNERSDLGELVHFVVAERDDTIATIEGEGGVALATNLVDGTRLGEPDFVDNFEFVERHSGGWFEAVTITSDDGFALVLLVPDRPDVNPALLSLVRDRP